MMRQCQYVVDKHTDAQTPSHYHTIHFKGHTHARTNGPKSNELSIWWCCCCCCKMDSRTIERRIPSALSRREDGTPNEFRQRLVSIGVTTCLLSLGRFFCLWTGLLSHLCLPHGGRTETPPLRVRARTCMHSYTHPHTQATDGCNFIEFNTRLPMLPQSCCRVWRVAAAIASGRQIGSRENKSGDKSNSPTILFLLFVIYTLLDHSPVNGIRTHTGTHIESDGSRVIIITNQRVPVFFFILSLSLSPSLPIHCNLIRFAFFKCLFLSPIFAQRFRAFSIPAAFGFPLIENSLKAERS